MAGETGVPAAPRWRSEWRALLAAEVCSVIGDQLAKVALSLVVYARTGNAALTGLVYALTLLPDLLAGPLLAPLADRWPARTVMVSCALIQAAAVGCMLIPGPLVLLAVPVAVVAALAAPFKAAQAVSIRLARSDHHAQSRIAIVREAGQFAGLGAAGAVVSTLGPTVALGIDAATFLLAALLLRVGLRRHLPPTPPPGAAPEATAAPAAAGTLLRSWGRTLGHGWRGIAADRRVLAIVLVVILISGTAAPESVLGPLIHQMAAPKWAAGLLVAADSAGFILLGTALSRDRVQPQTCLRALPVLALLAVAPLMLFFLQPTYGAATAVLLLSGSGSAYLAVSRGVITQLIPLDVTGSVNGLIRTGLRGGQGLIALAAGGLASTTTPTTAIGVIGLAATAGVVLVGAWSRSGHSRAAAAAQTTSSPSGVEARSPRAP